MKIIAVSDLHGHLPDIETCDLLCLCGDISPLEIQRDYIKMTKWIFNEFQEWIMNLACSNVILVPGNHDFWFNQFIKKSNTYLFNKLTILIDGETNIYDDSLNKWLKIYGTPHVPWIGNNWAYSKYDHELENLYNKIPKNVDILLTHAAPFCVCDTGLVSETFDFGSPNLTKAIELKHPKFVFCGHIHDGNHKLSEYEYTDFNNFVRKIKIVNVSLLDDNYKINYKPFTIMLKCCEKCGEVYSDDTENCFFCNQELIPVVEETNTETSVGETKELITNQQPLPLDEDVIDDEELEFLIEEIKDYELENSIVIEDENLEIEVNDEESETTTN